jgi:hypothetical protein
MVNAVGPLFVGFDPMGSTPLDDEGNTSKLGIGVPTLLTNTTVGAPRSVGVGDGITDTELDLVGALLGVVGGEEVTVEDTAMLLGVGVLVDKVRGEGVGENAATEEGGGGGDGSIVVAVKEVTLPTTTNPGRGLLVFAKKALLSALPSCQ